jgi:hypothetical protein
MKIKLTSAILAIALGMSLTACTADVQEENIFDAFRDNRDNRNNSTRARDSTTDCPTPDYPTKETIGAVDFLDSGVIRFESGEVTIQPGGMQVIVGGDMGQPGSGLIRQAGFQGSIRRDWVCPVDPDGQWATLVSQNGGFWENIAYIEADMFLTSPNNGDPKMLSNVEEWAVLGGAMGFVWYQSERNALSQFKTFSGDNNFGWGDTMTLVWDIDRIASQHGRTLTNHNPNREYMFNRAPFYPDEFSDEKIGGGLFSFGFMLWKDCDFSELTVKINWTDVRIHVHDFELYKEHLAQVQAITGISPSANNVTGGIFEVAGI